jgi:N-acetylmuramoyl-L-alanine amidase
VRQGETAASIAAAAGFLWSDTVWTAPENKDIRERRPDPNVLLPGDTLYLPDRTPPAFSLPTGAEHVLTVRRTKLQVRLRLLDWLGAPRAGEDCTVSDAGGDDLHLTTDSDGKIAFEVPADVRTATIACASGDAFALRIGGLNPADTLTGVSARLRNLGLQGRSTDSADVALADRLRLAFAVELFADLANTKPSKDTNRAFGDRIRKDYGL